MLTLRLNIIRFTYQMTQLEDTSTKLKKNERFANKTTFKNSHTIIDKPFSRTLQSTLEFKHLAMGKLFQLESVVFVIGLLTSKVPLQTVILVLELINEV